jgi:phage-related protein
MVTVSEVVVGLRSDGADDTKDDLQEVSDQTEETTQQLDEQSEQMTELAQGFAGALEAATVGLLAASAGLLSQVPVLGQLFDGLFAIVQAVALQMDQVLRPVLGPLSKKMFGFAQSISNAEGTAGDIIGVLGTIIAVLGTIVGAVVSAAVALGQGGALVSAASTAASVIAGVVGTIISVIGGVPLAVAAVVAAILGFIVAMVTNFGGFRDKVLSILSTLASKFVSGFKSFLQDPIGFISDFISAVVDLLFNTDWLGLGGKVGSAIVSGLKSKLGLGGEGDGGALDFNTEDILPDVDTSFSSAGNYEFGKSFKKQRNMEMTEPNTQLPGSGKSITEVYLDGRQIGQGTSGERFDESARRGQTF